tara:strand:- start:92 stop:1027 length:936 start_codon:yes stop_codon:yes gene_type:complete
MIKNILVTGGLGFIGSNLVDFLINEDYNVFVIDNLSTGLETNLNEKASYLKRDIVDFIDDADSIKRYLLDNKIDAVFHLAASADIFLSINYPEKVYKINLNASIAILNACKETQVKKFIFSSTSAVYGEPKILPVKEDAFTNPISPYGLSKLAFEQYLDFFALNSSIDFLTFRFPNVYGFRQRSDLEGGVVAIFEEAMKKNQQIKIFGDGNQTRDWVDVSDIVNALYLGMLSENEPEIINLGSSKQTSLLMLFKHLSDELHYKQDPLFLDSREGDIKHMVMDTERALKSINWKAKLTLEEGIKKLIKKEKN